jgi:tetrathionate reductase subunit A
MNPRPHDPVLDRRKFLANGALLGTALVTGCRTGATLPGPQAAVLNSPRPDVPYTLAQPDHILYSACLQCNTGCGIKCKIQDGIVSKIDGNPYNPWTLVPHLPAETPPEVAALVDGAICPKGQAGLQTAYDPYRLRKVLKRAGQRGENKWQTISFAQAVQEICEGGPLFAHVPGEENRQVEGLRAIMALTDDKIAKDMAADVKAIWDRKLTVAQFKEKHAAHLDKLIDPDHPDLGPKNNQIVLNWGRLKAGRGDFYKRFAAALGSVNAHGHTTVCQGSLYFTCKAISEQWTDGKFSGGQKFYWQADTANSRFVLFVGANLFEANYGPPNRTARLTEGLASGATRIAVADPRFSKLASKAWKWLPLKPGTDIALALGMIRWFFENDRYDKKFIANANKAAATAAGEPSWTNATWLVEITNGQPGKFVRAADLGLCQPETRATKDGKEYTEKFFVAMVNGQPTPVDPNDTQKPVVGDLLVDTTLNGVRVKSGLQILKESAFQHTIADWAAQADVPVADLIAVARELARHGKRAAVDIHRGPAQHTNGFYAVFAWMALNMLLGNFDHQGGMIAGGAYDIGGKGKRFTIATHPGKITAFGISSIRHEVDYEKTTLFAGYPAKRNWYPLASDVYQEVIPSIGDAYPYPVKALFMYMGAPTYALPAGHTTIDILRDVNKLPLFIANDILVGSTSMYADYIFPDTSFLERWEFQGTHFNIPGKVQPIRQPVMPPIPENCVAFGQTIPLSFEAMLLGLAERLALPGFGPDGFGPGLRFQHPDDLYLRQVANLAFGEKPDGSERVPAATPAELDYFLRARRHLPPTVFDPDRWRAIVGEDLWLHVVHVLNRGGRFQDHAEIYKPDGTVRNAYARQLNLYQEKTALTIHAGTGQAYPGYAAAVPIRDFLGREPVAQRAGHPFALITHRTISQCKTRTIGNPWLTPLMPDNGILINPADAVRAGFKPGQIVKIVSATNPAGEWPLTPRWNKPMTGKLVFTQTMRPGVISFMLGYGHWATGAVAITIDGQLIQGAEYRAAGINGNAAMWTDPHMPNTCLSDTIGGSVSFYDTKVKLLPA